MKFAYKFSNLLGTVYNKGNLIFTPDGNTVISPVGNRLSFFDLKNNKSETLPLESSYSFIATGLSPNGITLVAVTEEGEMNLISLISRTIIHKLRFNCHVSCVEFSPDGRYFAVAVGDQIFVYKAPGIHTKEFNPFVLEKKLTRACSNVTCMVWSSDSSVLAAGSEDMSVKLYTLKKFSNFTQYTLGGHTDVIVNCFFEKDSLDMYTLGRNSHLRIWECSLDLNKLVPFGQQKKNREERELQSNDDSEKTKEDEMDTSKDQPQLFYSMTARHYLRDNLTKENCFKITLTAAAYHPVTHILVTGFSTGDFMIHELPDVNLIHSLCIPDQEITVVTINTTGDWIALGCQRMGHLLVWEWQSETYILKQQGHFNNLICLDYSPDGQYIVTGGEDGLVKVWNTITGFCFVTFREHSASVTGVKFNQNGKAVLSASLDGTVRAFDMARYRNFKTLTSPHPAQFSCIAVDYSGQLVAAGSQDTFEIYLWSLQTGRLLEVLSGHEGPVSSLAFSPSPASSLLASVSWDKQLRLWDALCSSSRQETIHLLADGLFVTFRPDGDEVAVATLDGQIHFFHPNTGIQTGNLEGRNDLGSGRSDTDIITAKKSLQGKAFTTLCYTADGECLLAGGQSKNVCIYHRREQLLLKVFEITQNLSFDAMDEIIDRRKMTEYGNIALIEDREDPGNATKISLPGVRKGDMASRAFKPEVRVSGLKFSPTGRMWAATTTEGLLMYSLDHQLVFDPYHLEMYITPASIKHTLAKKEYTKALIMALRLNEQIIIQEVLENIPHDNVQMISQSLPEVYVQKVLNFVAGQLESSGHIEFYLIWTEQLLTQHGSWLKEKSLKVMPVLHTLQKNLTRKYEDLGKICDHNKYLLQYLSTLGEIKEREAIKSEKEKERDSEEGDETDSEMFTDSVMQTLVE